MSNIENQEVEEQKPDEMSMLKQRARMMGIAFSNNIGLDALKAKIQEKMEEGNADTVETLSPPLKDPEEPVGKVETLRQKLVRENMKLVRLRITNLDPKKKDLPGEIITVANEYLGTVRKFVPFGEVTENGYHVPYCIYKLMKARKFLNIRTITNKQNNNQIRIDQRWVPEFALEVLPQLNKEEIARLAAAQIAAGSLD